MSEVKSVDARGLSCPEPTMLTDRAIRAIKEGTIEVLVDSGTAKENVSRLARNAGWTVQYEDQPGGVCRIVLKK